MDPVRWALIGASSIADQHMTRALRSSAGSEVVALWSSSARRGNHFASQHGIPRVYTELDQLLSDPSLTAVYVSSWNHLHARQVIAAAAAGKHVLCEKPLALTMADAQATLDACAKAGVVLAVNHPLRASRIHARMRHLVAEGAIGAPISGRVLNAQYLPPELRTWRLDPRQPGSGVIFDLTVHDADLLRFVLDADVDAVTGVTCQTDASRATEVVWGTMRLTTGLVVAFHDAFGLRFAGTALEIHGADGSLVATNNMTADPTGSLVLRGPQGAAEIDVAGDASAYAATVHHVNAAIRGGGDPLATGDDGARSLAVAIAVQAAVISAAQARVPALREGITVPPLRA